MARASRDLYTEDNVPVLRFEDSEDFQSLHAKAGNANSSPDYSSYAAADDPFTELKHKQESLLRIRQELEKTQREAEELEARKNKEDRFATGRRHVTENLARSLAKLERELYNSQKAIEEISVARDSFQRHLDALRDIHPEHWHRSELDEELDRAIGAVEDAEEDYAKISRRLQTVVSPREDGGGGLFSLRGGSALMPANFATMFQMGFAFSLPLIIAALVVVLIVKLLP